MIERRKPISVGEAIAKVIKNTEIMPVIEVSLAEALYRYLAEPIIARHPVPSFTNSPFDGFAIRAEDSALASKNNKITFQVIDHIGAGQVSEMNVGPFEAVRIMTGAAIPEGADAVVMLEQAIISGDTFQIQKKMQQSDNISFVGEDVQAGEVVISSGSYIHPGTTALLATFGYETVSVRKRPHVGVICTGSELMEIGEELQHGKIRNSNGPMIMAQLKRLGIDATYYGTMSDEFDTCLKQVRDVLEEVDCLVTTGGVSVGDFDYLPAIYEALGADVLFNKVGMRPGSVTTVANLAGTLLFGLSGNPSACYSGFELFVRPSVLTMMGSKRPYLPHTKAVLSEDILKPNPFTRFLRSTCNFNGQTMTVAPAGFNKSNAVGAIGRANAFIVLPSRSKAFYKGDMVDVLLLGTEEGEAEWKL